MRVDGDRGQDIREEKAVGGGEGGSFDNWYQSKAVGFIMSL